LSLENALDTGVAIPESEVALFMCPLLMYWIGRLRLLSGGDWLREDPVVSH